MIGMRSRINLLQLQLNRKTIRLQFETSKETGAVFDTSKTFKSFILEYCVNYFLTVAWNPAETFEYFIYGFKDNSHSSSYS